MSQEFPIPRQDARPEQVATVQWGEDEPRRPDRRLHLLARVGQDPRLVLVLGALGALAVFASLVGEWIVLTLPNFDPSEGGIGRAPTGVSDVGGFGVSYLIGILAVVTSLALVLFGTPATRRNIRVVGLTLAGALLALLVAATMTMNERSRLVPYGPADGLEIAYGRGLVMAYVGTAALGLALYLAGRFGPPRPVAEPAGDRPAASDQPVADQADEFDWRSRRTTPAILADELDDVPRDLTVAPTTPFAQPEPPDGR